MYYDLMKLQTEMDMSKYSLKDLALYFEKYDGYICQILTEKRKIKVLLEVNSFTHLIGIHHAFKGKKDKNKYKGASGFEKIKNGEITYTDIMKAAKNNNDSISWASIKNRIKYLPMFFNTISSKNTYLKIRDDKLICRKIYLNGSYFIYKSLYNNIYPILSLKKVSDFRTVIETFIIDKDLSLIGALPNEKIISIKLIPPLDNTSPITIIKNKDTQPVG